MAGSESTSHIIQSLIVNLIIASGKGVAAFITGSGAILAETIHSFADCSNQILLLRGVRGAEKPPSASHPLGYGRVAYFWSFMVALLLFTGGGVFSVYEGFHKLHEPEPVSNIGVGIGIILFALVLEGWATYSNVKEFNARRGTTRLVSYLKETKDSGLVVLFGENSAATFGLLFALAAQVLSWLTNDSRWDAVGCLCIGVILIAVAIFLAIEVQSLLIGESADPAIEATVSKIASTQPGVTKLLHLIALQQGPGQVILLVKLAFNPALDVGKLSDTINEFEKSVRTALPEVKWCFVEPDRPRS